jgi:hypothetical protein
MRIVFSELACLILAEFLPMMRRSKDALGKVEKSSENA